jgi:uncharacterized membrane protein
MQNAVCSLARTRTCDGTTSALFLEKMNLTALQQAAVAGNMSVFAVGVTVPMHRRRRARLPVVVVGIVLGFVGGVALGLAFAEGVHSGLRSVVATVPLVLVFAQAATRGSLYLRSAST